MSEGTYEYETRLLEICVEPIAQACVDAHLRPETLPKQAVWGQVDPGLP